MKGCAYGQLLVNAAAICTLQNGNNKYIVEVY